MSQVHQSADARARERARRATRLARRKQDKRHYEASAHARTRGPRA